jgi:hypothetical protein
MENCKSEAPVPAFRSSAGKKAWRFKALHLRGLLPPTRTCKKTQLHFCRQLPLQSGAFDHC